MIIVPIQNVTELLKYVLANADIVKIESARFQNFKNK